MADNNDAAESPCMDGYEQDGTVEKDGEIVPNCVPIEDSETPDETRHTVSESADKIVLKTEVKRGEGTRDQDKVNVKVKGNEPAPTADKLARVLDSLEELEVSNRQRETQPGEDDD